MWRIKSRVNRAFLKEVVAERKKAIAKAVRSLLARGSSQTIIFHKNLD